jgi:hypothetical protein
MVRTQRDRKPGVIAEQTQRVGGRVLDVTPSIADHELVAIHDAHGVHAHGLAFLSGTVLDLQSARGGRWRMETPPAVPESP